MNTKNTTIGNLFPCLGKTALFIALGLLCACPAFAQRSETGSINGRIYDADAGRFMSSADMAIEGTSLAAVSEQGGFYVLNNVPVGEVTVVVSYAGYVTEKKVVTVTAGGQVTADFDLHLKPTGPVASGAKKDDDQIIVLEGLTVTTNRSGNARAFMEQKNSMTMSTVLAADSFGTIQDGNIAEFLRQAPGISVIEDSASGEANEISLGGMDPQYTGVYMDGSRMASGGGGWDEGGSRTFQFSQVSINGIESIEIRRTVSADMEGDAPAGGISMKTKSAFDRKEAVLRYNGYFTANSYNMDFKRTPGADDGENYKILPGFNLTYSTPFNKNKMGLVIEAGGQMDFRETNQGSNEINANSWTTGNPFLYSVQYRNTQVDSERANVSARFDWKISPYTKMSFRLSHELRNTTQFNRTLTFRTADSGKKGNTSNESNLLTWKMESDSSGIDSFVNVQQSATYKESTTDMATLTFDWKRNRFELNTVATFSYAVTEVDPSKGKWFPIISIIGPNTKYDTWATRSATDKMDWSFYRGDIASLTPYDNLVAQFGEITRFGQNGVTAISDPLPTNNKQTIPTLKADLRWTAPTSFPLWFKTGINARQSKYDAWQPTYSGGSALTNRYQYIGPNDPRDGGKAVAGYDARGSTSLAGTTDAQPLSSEYFRSAYHFDSHFGGNVASLNIPIINQTLLYQTYQQHPEWFFQAARENAKNARIAGYTGKRDLAETIAAGYIMGEAKPWRGWVFQAGLRYEFTDQKAHTLIPLTNKQTHTHPEIADNSLEVEDTDKFIDLMYKKGERTKTSNSYSFMLPSAALKYEFTPNLVAHLGYSEGFGRIGVEKLAGNWKVDDTNLKATAPNPSLEPDHFRTYSAAVEYYFEPAGSFTFTYSYRKWDGVTYESMRVTDNLDNPSPEMQALMDVYGRETIESFLNSQYDVYTWQAESVDNRAMHTLEFAYRQRIPAIPGLQVDANFTNVIPNWRKTGASGASKIASGGLNYTNRNLYVRVSANWRDRYYDKWSDENYNSQLGKDARLLLNAEATYRITKGLYLYATANNILNAPTSTWVVTPDNLRDQTLQGISFRLGVKNYF